MGYNFVCSIMRGMGNSKAPMTFVIVSSVVNIIGDIVLVAVFHMGAAGAAEVLYAKEAKESENPKAFIAEKEAEYNRLFANPYQAAKYGYIDDVIEPRNTRFRIIRALAQLENKKLTNPAKKHGNIPL